MENIEKDSKVNIYIYIDIVWFENTKGIIRIRKSKKDMQNHDPKKYKRAYNDLQNITQKTNDRAFIITVWLDLLLYNNG